MTKKQSEINETKIRIFTRDNFKCRRCGRPAFQIAHGIGQDHSSKKNRNNAMVRREWNTLFGEMIDKTQAEKIINHPLNLFSVCSLECNSFFNITNNPVKVRKMLYSIHDDISGQTEYD